MVLLVFGAGLGKRPLLCKPHGGIPRSSEIQDLQSRLHPGAVVPQYQPKDMRFSCSITSAFVSSLLGGWFASMAFFGRPKLPQQREGPGLSLCV